MKFSTNSVLVDAARVYNAIYKASDHPDSVQTCETWQNTVIATRNALLEVQKQIDAQEKELAEIYQPQAVKSIMADTKETMRQLVSQEQIRLTNALDAVLDAKMTKYKKTALTAPTDEQNRLLNTLALRDDLTEVEVARIAESMADNHQALRALKSIAKKSGIDLLTPPSVESTEESIDRAREYAAGALRDIATDPGEMGYFSRTFYAGYNIGPGKVLADLDKAGFTQVEHEDGQDAG